MNRNSVYILEDRGLLYINGDDAKEFLQNIITNNIENVSDNRSCFSALLTPQGKYLYDFIIIFDFGHNLITNDVVKTLKKLNKKNRNLII